jgi:hypothetical protein
MNLKRLANIIEQNNHATFKLACQNGNPGSGQVPRRETV